MSDAAALLLSALRGIAGSPHAPSCHGFEARLLRFKCTCYVRIAKKAVAEYVPDIPEFMASALPPAPKVYPTIHFNGHPLTQVQVKAVHASIELLILHLTTLYREDDEGGEEGKQIRSVLEKCKAIRNLYTPEEGSTHDA